MSALGKIPSTPATDGALSFYPLTALNETLADPVWDAVGLVTNWTIDPAVENELLFYAGSRRLQNNKKMGAQYNITFDTDVHALDLFDRVTKDANGTGTAEQFCDFATRVKYNNVDHYWLVEGALFGEVNMTINRGIVKASYSCPVVKNVRCLTYAEFQTATGVIDPDTPQFNAPPAPDPLFGQSPGLANPLPLKINAMELEFETINIRHTNVVILKRSSNVEIATAAVIGHQQVNAEITLYEEDREYFNLFKDNTNLNIEVKVTPTQKLVMNNFKASGAPINHPQTGNDLGMIPLAIDGPACIVTTY